MGSAPLIPTTFVGPGLKGLNTQLSASLLGPEWATEALNCVFDDANRLASRDGWTSITSTPIGGTPNVEQIFEFKPAPGSSNQIISTAANNIYAGTTAPASITGAVAITANNWKFVNFNGLAYGLQASHALISWTGGGNFANVTASSGSVPTGNELLAAFGRLWATEADGSTIKYSGLLNGTQWASGGAGSINLLSVWPTADEIVALAAFNAFLVVFGKRNIVLIGDTTGSALGIDPADAFVVDMIPGIGCIARDSVQNINGDDLVFLSHSGIYSLRRVIEERSNPLREISANVRDHLVTSAAAENVTQIRSAYVPKKGMYLLLLPSSGIIFAFSTKAVLENGSWRATKWDNFFPRSLHALEDGTTLHGGSLGRIFAYSGQLDNGTSYRYVFRSGWMDMGPDFANRLKLFKRLAAIVFLSGATTLVFKWAFDFSTATFNVSRDSTFSGTGAEWGLGEWGLGEFGGSVGLREFEMPGQGSGQFIQVGLEADISSDQLALQQMQVFAKAGRLV